jgi:hypothetical protein
MMNLIKKHNKMHEAADGEEGEWELVRKAKSM